MWVKEISENFSFTPQTLLMIGLINQIFYMTDSISRAFSPYDLYSLSMLLSTTDFRSYHKVKNLALLFVACHACIFRRNIMIYVQMKNVANATLPGVP